jgi:hypothetical protein
MPSGLSLGPVGPNIRPGLTNWHTYSIHWNPPLAYPPNGNNLINNVICVFIELLNKKRFKGAVRGTLSKKVIYKTLLSFLFRTHSLWKELMEIIVHLMQNI